MSTNKIENNIIKEFVCNVMFSQDKFIVLLYELNYVLL